ncbi:MAG: hypothetical protein D6707_12060 [Bacteroidetes bacterium]|nr:MAG: hypothetical protein D6707_12060 [Bacteroidota bacterium]
MVGFNRKTSITLQVDAELYHYYKSLGWSLGMNFESGQPEPVIEAPNLERMLENIFVREIEKFIVEGIWEDNRKKYSDHFQFLKAICVAIKSNPAVRRVRFKIPDIEKRVWSRCLEKLENMGINTTALLKYFSKEEIEDFQ